MVRWIASNYAEHDGIGQVLNNDVSTIIARNRNAVLG
jgi:hypothetical protein